jgi:hypothetical protein
VLLLALGIIVKYIGGVMIHTCVALVQMQIVLCTQVGGALAIYFILLCLYLANPYVVIKHQKGGD